MLWRTVKNLYVRAVIIVVMQMDVVPAMVCIVFPCKWLKQIMEMSTSSTFSTYFSKYVFLLFQTVHVFRRKR